MENAAILINVDDVEAERSARTAVLSNAGYRIHVAATAQQALDLVDQHHPDLVMVHLHDGDGNEMCRRLKTNGRAVAVLQIGAESGRDTAADACLNEPVDPTVLVATIRVVLRMREAERTLEASNARLEAVNRQFHQCTEDFQQFAYVVSHDLQEPLRTVSTFVEMIAQETQERLTEAQKGYLAHVLAGANRMHILITDLLAFSRCGGPTRANGVVGMSGVVAWAIGDLGKQVSEAGAAIRVAARLPKVMGDFAQLGQVTRNLLSNAMKFRKPDVPLVIEVTGQEVDSEHSVIRVRDNGIGIPPEYHEKIFVPFKRLHGQEIPGTGMGLAVCRRIVNAHNGRIWVESELNHGSTFLLKLPSASSTAKGDHR